MASRWMSSFPVEEMVGAVGYCGYFDVEVSWFEGHEMGRTGGVRSAQHGAKKSPALGMYVW
jgi:hypothetical protein